MPHSRAREPLIKSRVVAALAFRDGMREAGRNEWSIPFVSSVTMQTARKAAPHTGWRAKCQSASLRSSASWDRPRPSSCASHLATLRANATHEGFNQWLLHNHALVALDCEQTLVANLRPRLTGIEAQAAGPVPRCPPGGHGISRPWQSCRQHCRRPPGCRRRRPTARRRTSPE